MSSSSVLEKGLIPLENETIEQYNLRLQTATFHRSQNFKAAHSARALTQKLFGFSADWIPIRFGNKNLTLLEAGAAFLNPKGSFLGWIQLRKHFRTHERLFFCSLEEIIAHEMVHVVRSQVPGEKYEEIFAYMTSKNPLRRIFGPLFDKTYESILFLLLMLFAELSLPFHMPLFLLPFLFFTLYLALRLFRRNATIKRASARLKDPKLLIFLSDQEIEHIAQNPNYYPYFQEIKQDSLRIKSLYNLI